jgi:nucleotide-binding universal stress UspA family protein
MSRTEWMRAAAGADAGGVDRGAPARAPRVHWTFRSLAKHTEGFGERNAVADSARESRPSTHPAPEDDRRPAIVCGVDDSAEARRALDAAMELARRLDVRPVIVRVGQAPTQHESESAELEAWAADSNPPRDAEYKVVYGMPGESLVQAANEIGATLIVVGTRARGRIAAALRGSASADVIAHAACPVLVVPNANA